MPSITSILRCSWATLCVLTPSIGLAQTLLPPEQYEPPATITGLEPVKKAGDDRSMLSSMAGALKKPVQGLRHATIPTDRMHDPFLQPVSAMQNADDAQLAAPATGVPAPGVEQHVWPPSSKPRVFTKVPESPEPWITMQSGRFRSTILPGDGDDLGITTLDGRVKLGVPRVEGLTVSPGYEISWLDGPMTTDLPAQLHATWVELAYNRRLARQWALQLAVSPGYYSDFEQSNSDGVRILGRALMFWWLSRQTQLTFGAVYLDRDNLPALPAVGLIHSPSEDSRIELVFPRPRVLYRLFPGEVNEGWVYLAGELGGGTWAIERTTGAEDTVTYNDLRLVTGFELRNGPQRRLFVEAAYVFAREIEYDSGLGDFDPDDTGMLRLGVAW